MLNNVLISSQLVSIIVSFVALSSIEAFINYRSLSYGGDNQFKYGFINMKAYPNKTLNLTANMIFTVVNASECALHCVEKGSSICISISVKQNGSEFSCSLYSLDKHRAYPHFIDKPGTIYYNIDNQCEYPQRCPHANHWCIPDYLNGEYTCVCKHGYIGVNCESPKTGNMNLHLTDRGTEPAVINFSVGDSWSLALWFYYDGTEITHKLIFGIGFMPGNCGSINVEVLNGMMAIGNSEVPFHANFWQHLALNIDYKSGTINIFLNGADKGTASFHAEMAYENVNLILANSQRGGCLSYTDESIRPESIKFTEIYVWDRHLDFNDFIKLFRQTFVPYGPKMTWDDILDVYTKANNIQGAEFQFHSYYG